MLWPISALLLALITVFWGIGAYGRLTVLRKAFAQAFTHIDVQIKQRHRAMHALIEKLARTQLVQSDALDGINALHQGAVQASERLSASPLDIEAMHDLTATDGAFTAALGNLMKEATRQGAPATAEFMLQLAEERRSMDNRIAFARQGYNQTVAQYNAALAQFPRLAVARLLGFKPGHPWQSTDAPIERRQEHRGA